MLKFRKLVMLSSLLALFALPVLAVPVSTSSNVQIGSQVVFGLQNQFPNTLFQYQEPNTTTCQFEGSSIVQVAANSTDTQVNTATLFPGFTKPVCYVVTEITNPSLPLNIGLSNGGPRLQLAAGGFLLVRVEGGFPTFYVDNPSATQPALLRVVALSN
jgi:hypothetical protein